MLRRFTAPAALAASLLGCSDPAPAPPQAAIVFTVRHPGGEANCPVTGIQYSLPSDPAAATAILESGGEADGELYRVVDGKDDVSVSCTVSQTDDTTFDFVGRIDKARSVNFFGRGTLTTTGGTIEISENDTNSGILGVANSDECTVNLDDKYISQGAVWASFECPMFQQDTITCAASGTIIFENCEK